MCKVHDDAAVVKMQSINGTFDEFRRDVDKDSTRLPAACGYDIRASRMHGKFTREESL